MQRAKGNINFDLSLSLSLCFSLVTLARAGRSSSPMIRSIMLSHMALKLCWRMFPKCLNIELNKYLTYIHGIYLWGAISARSIHLVQAGAIMQISWQSFKALNALSMRNVRRLLEGHWAGVDGGEEIEKPQSANAVWSERTSNPIYNDLSTVIKTKYTSGLNLYTCCDR